MNNDLTNKNNFVISLRDHLINWFGTDRAYTYGEGNSEVRVTKGFYCLYRREGSEPEDITGFCFRKDLCAKVLYEKKDILDHICDFAMNVPSLEEVSLSDNGLSFSLNDKNYLVSVGIGKGPYDVIDVSVMESISVKNFFK
ncbi:hypothetical protein K9L97_04130 [Candidatus Woesearchaeota archaeon]|nr:hypothetical protein [Candidatus Woesearchaeota archaeon]